MDKAKLDSLRGELLTTQEGSSGEATEPSDTATDTETSAEEAPPAESETAAISGKVYWTNGGSVYHRDRDCYHLKKSQSVSEGSVEQAVSLGKGRLCASCEKKTTP